jgi:large subunit ribosomal protein L6
MRKKMIQKVQIPEGIECSLQNGFLKCKKDSTEISKDMNVPRIEVKAEGNEVVVQCAKGNKIQYKTILSLVAHINNMFSGLNEKFVYKLESVNVHFPMTIKVDGDKLTIGNFLGEKTPRHAKIMPNVEVEIKGQNITISSINREAAGQTAANFEKATRVKGKDKRIYQDGIYITEKPGRFSVAAARKPTVEREASQQEQTKMERKEDI